MRLTLIRHGESTGNVSKRLQGQREFPLTERGRAQAQRIGIHLARDGIASLYSSSIGRSWETAEIAGRVLGLEPQTLPGVEEYDFGDLSGLSMQEIAEQAPQVAAMMREQSPEFPRYPGEEGRDEFRRRVSDAIWGLAGIHNDAAVAVMTHAGPITSFISEVLNRPYARPFPLRIDNASLTLVELWDDPEGGRRGVLVTLNNTCHLH